MIRALISDLGNVLLHFDHRIIRRRLEELYPGVLREQGSKGAFWSLVGDFETGEVDADEFLPLLAAVLNLPDGLDKARFFEVWGDIFWLNREYFDLLTEVRGRVKLVMLSNTNPLHIDFARARFPEAFALFDHTVFSYECGFAKPDPRIFQNALTACGIAPEEALYVDDIAAYTTAAGALGMHAYQYVSTDALRDVLNIYELHVTAPNHADITGH
ncbi:MAG: HAD family phosphatase [Bacteroidia bacterium]|nr:HAD family phosphatase [Bacteroidia bacterium]